MATHDGDGPMPDFLKNMITHIPCITVQDVPDVSTNAGKRKLKEMIVDSVNMVARRINPDVPLASIESLKSTAASASSTVKGGPHNDKSSITVTRTASKDSQLFEIEDSWMKSYPPLSDTHLPASPRVRDMLPNGIDASNLLSTARSLLASMTSAPSTTIPANSKSVPQEYWVGKTFPLSVKRWDIVQMRAIDTQLPLTLSTTCGIWTTDFAAALGITVSDMLAIMKSVAGVEKWEFILHNIPLSGVPSDPR